MGKMLLQVLSACPLFDKNEEGEVNLFSIKNYLLLAGLFAMFFVVVSGVKLLRK